MAFRWRMSKPCENCPFNKTGEGAELRRSMRGKRWNEILHGLRNNMHFPCHKTTYETGNGKNLLCAGAIQWQEKRGLTSNLQRVMERVEYLAKKGLLSKQQ